MAESRIKTISEDISHLVRGCFFVGLPIRWGTWPQENIYSVFSMPENKLTYWQLYQKVFKWNKLKELNANFFQTGFLQTIGKSFSNSGILDYVDHKAKKNKWSTLRTGVTTAWLCTFAETLLITDGEKYKIESYARELKTGSFKKDKVAKKNVRTTRIRICKK